MQQYKFKYNPIEDCFDLVTIPGISDSEFEIIAPGNTGKDQLGNWKFLIDAGMNLCKYKCTFAYPITWELVEMNDFYQYP